MKKDLRYLAKQLEKDADNVSLSFNVKIEYALYLIERLAYNSPVDTSALLSNWQITTQPLKSAPMAAFHVGSKGSTRIASLNTLLAHSRQVAASIKKHQKVYIVNKLPYVERQNQEHKFAKGFVEKSILEAKIKFGIK